MYGRKRSILGEAFLSLLSLLYNTLIRLRAACYRLHVFTRHELPCAVISIGNITLGGTGKTPAVIQIAGLLHRQNRHPVVISRGYGRKDESEFAVVSNSSSVLVDARTGGDEPVLIAAKLPGVPVVVGRDRFRAGLEALRQFAPDIVILDDGFQHIQLKRTLDLVLVDARDPFGNRKLFPAGILREPLGSLKRAHAVLITNAGVAEDVQTLKNAIRQHTNAGIFTSRQTPLDLINVNGGEIKPLSVLKGSRVLAFSGIARPGSFTTMLQSLGAIIAAECTYPDHYDFKRSDLAAIFRKAADEKVSMIVTTEKDGVRLKDASPEGIWALRIELTVDEPEAWEALLLKSV
jgi:tetraacyldisaccharide 4'-kinase